MSLGRHLLGLIVARWLCIISHGADRVSLLPVFPPDFESRIANSSTYRNPHPNKLIPRNLWITFKTKPIDVESEIGASLLWYISLARNDSWRVHLLGHEEQEAFLDEFYPGTAISWAYKQIHPDCGASASDIFRYAALHAFGGMFIDDDSIMNASPERVVRPNDTLVMTQERTIADSKIDCYHSSYKLSRVYMRRNYHFDNFRAIYGGKVVAQWAFLSSPRHPVLRRVLENSMDLIKREWMRESVIFRFGEEPLYKLVFCCTGPNLLTSTIADMWLESNGSLPLRMTNLDFREYGGEFKVDDKGWLHRKDSHYMTKMTRNRSPLLRSFSDFNVSHYEGRPIRVVHKDVLRNPIYLVLNGTKRWIPDFDTFHALNFSHESVMFIYDNHEYSNIPEGSPMPALDFKG